jgi:hypothetical protein
MAVVNFAESARRHWKDTEVLSAQGRFGNAGQLLGFSAECGLKAIYRCLFLPAAANGDIDWDSIKHADKKKHDKYHAHVNFLCKTVAVLASSPDSSTYQSMIPSIGAFMTWSINQRYWSDAEHARIAAAELPQWEQAAREVMVMLDAAQKDGKTL